MRSLVSAQVLKQITDFRSDAKDEFCLREKEQLSAKLVCSHLPQVRATALQPLAKKRHENTTYITDCNVLLKHETSGLCTPRAGAKILSDKTVIYMYLYIRASVIKGSIFAFQFLISAKFFTMENQH